MTEQVSTFTADETALEWACQYFSYADKSLIRHYPWSRIFQLAGDGAKAYLKLTPRKQPEVLRINSVLTEHFVAILPELIAVSHEHGLLLLRDHGGIDLSEDASEAQLRELLKTYAGMQSRSAQIPAVLAALPAIKLPGFLDKFLEFLSPVNQDSNTEGGMVNADYFIGADQCKLYYDLLHARKELLGDYLQFAEQLPFTINHCDLRTGNAAESHDGSCILYDWDDAVSGPAGLSLHSLFDSCTRVARLLTIDHEIVEDTEHDAETRRDRRLLNAYMTALEKGGYAPAHVIRAALPATACIGRMQCLLTYANFPDDDKYYVEGVAGQFRDHLGDLLDLCDFLAGFNRTNVLEFSRNYQHKKGLRRAAALLQNYLGDHPNDFEVRKELADVLLQSGKWEDAISSYKTMLQSDPEDAQIHNDYGVALLKNNKPAAAAVEFEHALYLQPSFAVAQGNRDKALELVEVIEKAGRATEVPTLCVSKEEVKQRNWNCEKLRLATELFTEHGTLVVENAFPPELLHSIKELVMHKYQTYYEDKEHDDALFLSDRRYMVTLDIEAPLNTPEIYANPYIGTIVERLLGENFILGGLNIAVSLPGASHQAVHKDYPALFGHDDELIDTSCYAVSVLIPLVRHSHMVGTTLVVKGSHVVSSEEAEEMPDQSPLLDVGSCLMMDYRLSHQGLANRSDIVRPVLCLIFHRPWFRDAVNYSRQPAIKITDEEFECVPEHLRHLFTWASLEPTQERKR